MRTDVSEIKPVSITRPEKQIIYGMLLREEFRQMLLHTEYGRDYYLDDPTYVDIPESVGCFRTWTEWKLGFQTNGNSLYIRQRALWTVYETDERGRHILIREHEDPLAAYQDAASRRRLLFFPSETAKSVLRDSQSQEQLSRELRTIRLTIQSLKKVDQLMCLTENPDAVKLDLIILEKAAGRIEKEMSINRERTLENAKTGDNRMKRAETALRKIINGKINYSKWAGQNSYPASEKHEEQLAYAFEEQ